MATFKRFRKIGFTCLKIFSILGVILLAYLIFPAPPAPVLPEIIPSNDPYQRVDQAMDRCWKLCKLNVEGSFFDKKIDPHGVDPRLYCLIQCTGEFSEAPKYFVKKYIR